MKRILVVLIIVLAMASTPVKAAQSPPEGAIGQVVALKDNAPVLYSNDVFPQGTVAWVFALSDEGGWAATAVGPGRWVSLTNGYWAKMATGAIYAPIPLPDVEQRDPGVLCALARQPRLPGEDWYYPVNASLRRVFYAKRECHTEWRKQWGFWNYPARVCELNTKEAYWVCEVSDPTNCAVTKVPSSW